MNWVELIGSEPEQFCGNVYATRPDWATGMISYPDAKFLFRRALEAAPTSAIEVGTASGVSTAILAHAVHWADRAHGRSGSEVISYDIARQFYADRSRRVGDATREMLEEDLLRRVTFRNPATCADATAEHGPDSLEFVFIDANHLHPWPTLDMLAILPALRPGAEVVLHDINLPVRNAHGDAAGAKYLFDDLDVEKRADQEDPIPNIGSVSIPADKDDVRVQLQQIVNAHDWEEAVPDEVAAPLLDAS